jgi:hypothetical protein
MAQKISETTTFVNFFMSRINGEGCTMFAESQWIKKQQDCFVALSIRTFLLVIFYVCETVRVVYET